MHLTANLKQPSWQQNTDQLTKRIDHLLSLRHDYFLSSFFLGFLKPKLITGLGVLPAPDCFFFVCLFVCWNKPRKTVLRLLCHGWEKGKPPGSDHTRAEAKNVAPRDLWCPPTRVGKAPNKPSVLPSSARQNCD